MESNFIMNGIEKSTDDSILIEMEFACCRCAAQCYFVLDLMFVLCECDKQDILKQNMFATLANKLNESEKGFLKYNRSFHFGQNRHFL